MADPVKGVMEDIRKGILLTDFSGGIVTDTGGLSLLANQSPDALNVFAWEGNLHFRGGYNEFCSLPAAADGAYTYYDRNQNVHLVQWAGGNMYDCTTGNPVLIASGVYTPGQQIAHAQLNGILYWATLTVPLRQWDSVTEQAVPNSGGTGVVAPPACLFLVDFNGSLVAVNVVVGGVPNPGAFMWSNVNDPTTWVGANTQAVGSNDGGNCVFAILMGVAQVGVTPSKQFLVGKDNRQIFLYAGALGALTENAISSPVGILQGDSAVYIPTAAGLGGVMFLGEDGQFYLTNGIECPMASQNIKLLCSSLVSNALAANPNQRFNAIYNQRFQYYMCDFGNNTQLVYKWDVGGDGKPVGAWWLFQGWPSGVYTAANIERGLPSIYVGANYGGVTGVYELALDQTDDNGNDITAYWTSAYIHGGKPERLKIFQECTLFSYNVGVQYKVTATGLPQSNQIIPQTKELLFNDPAVGAISPDPGSASLWDVAKWDEGVWGGGATSVSMPYQIGGMKGPLVVPASISKWGPAGYPLPLRTGAAQFKIEWNAGIPDFRVTSFKIAYLPQNENVGILPFSGQGQVVSNFSADRTRVLPGNPFTNTGLPLPNALPAAAPTPTPTPGSYNLAPYQNAQYYYAAAAGQHDLLAISSDGLYIYFGAAANAFADSICLKVDALTGSVLAISPTQAGQQVQKIVLSPDNTKLYCYTRFPNTLIVYDTSDMSIIHTEAAFTALTTVESLDVTPDGNNLVFSFDSATDDILVMDTSTYGTSVFHIATSTGTTFACVKPNGNILLSWSGAGVGGDVLSEYSTGGAAVTTYTLGLHANDGTATLAPFGVHPTTGTIFGCQSVGTTRTLFAYNGSLLASTVLAGTAPVEGIAFNPLDTKAYFTTQDDKLISFDSSGTVATTDLLALFPADSTGQFSSIGIYYNLAFIYSQNDNGPTYDLVLNLAALP